MNPRRRGTEEGEQFEGIQKRGSQPKDDHGESRRKEISTLHGDRSNKTKLQIENKTDRGKPLLGKPTAHNVPKHLAHSFVLMSNLTMTSRSSASNSYVAKRPLLTITYCRTS